MKKFEELTSVAALIDVVNIDTDMIIPKQFLKTITRTGLGKFAFYEMRTHENGAPNMDFVLNKPEFQKAEILLAGANFGCGSSREHAPWALADFGFRCVISSSFADIFYNNCFENGILPAIISPDDYEKILALYEQNNSKEVHVNLAKRLIEIAGQEFKFQIEDSKAEKLLLGLDNIGLTLTKESEILSYENERKKKFSWL